MNKSPDAFRTISEVAEDLDIPQHVLRFWETRFTPIRPLKRGGGRRYYRPDDVDLLKGIRHLLYGQGYTIKGVQRILKESGPRSVQAIGRGEQAPAPLPPPGPAETAEYEADAREAAMFGEGSGHDPEPLEPAPSVSAGAMTNHGGMPRGGPEPGDLRAGDLARLRSALDELLECRRVLDSLQRR